MACLSGAVLMLAFLKMRIMTLVSLAFIGGVSFVVIELALEIAFLSTALLLFCVGLGFTKLEKYMIAYGIVTLLLVCWFNSVTLAFYAISNIVFIFARLEIVGKIKACSRIRTMFAIGMMLYIVLFKVSFEINPGEYPHSF